MNRMKPVVRPMATAKILAAATVGLVFGMLSIYGLLNPQLRVLEIRARVSDEFGQIRDPKEPTLTRQFYLLPLGTNELER